MAFNLDQSLGFILGRTSTRMKNNLLHSFKDFDVTPEQWAILNRLWEKEEISPKELAEMTSKDQPTTVRILKKLENKGFITRKVNPEDNRAFLISLTSEGRGLKDKLIPVALEVLAKAVRDIDQKQLDEVITVLNKVFKNLE